MSGPIEGPRAREQRAAPGERDFEGGVGFLRGGARPPVQEVIAFIDEHRSRFGVEPICRVLREHDCGIAPNTYWVAKKRPPSARALRDVELVAEVHRVFEENLFVSGADKIWTQLNHEEIRVARCTVEWLMRAEGLCGARRGKAFTITTQGDDRLHRPADLVARKFRAPAPDRLWVADLTYVKTHSGWVYVAFIIDVYSRMIVGWQASRSLRSDLAIDALEMAVWNRRRAGRDLDQLIHHSDRSVQGRSATPSDSLTTTSSRRSDPRATVTTTQWPSRSTGSTNGNRSTRKVHGAISTTSSSPR